MGIAFLKYRDTLPILEVVLKNPDGSVFNLTGSTDWKLHIWLNDGTGTTKLIRTMTKFGADAGGTLRYQWITTDWDVYASAGAVGGLSLTGAWDVEEHRMEYEVIGAGGARLTFPNGGHDTLRITRDIGQG